MLENLLIGLLAIALGLLVAFAGYPLFRVVLPIAGLVYGFMFANAVFNSWLIGIIIGFVLGLGLAFGAYAIWSYVLGFAGAVLGMSLGVGIGDALGLWGWLTLLISLALGAALFAVAMKLKDLVVIVATAVAGAGMVAYGAAVILPSMFGETGSRSFLYFLAWLGVAIIAFVFQQRLFKDKHLYDGLTPQPETPVAL